MTVIWCSVPFHLDKLPLVRIADFESITYLHLLHQLCNFAVRLRCNFVMTNHWTNIETNFVSRLVHQHHSIHPEFNGMSINKTANKCMRQIKLNESILTWNNVKAGKWFHFKWHTCDYIKILFIHWQIVWIVFVVFQFFYLIQNWTDMWTQWK